MTKILLTGASGHAGSFLLERILNKTDWDVISVERLGYQNALDRRAHLNLEQFGTRFQRLHHDFRAPLPDWFISSMEGKLEYVIHNGAEVHAIRSLTEPRNFVMANILGTFNMLEAARGLKPRKFIYTSSAEVLGPANPGASHSEDSALFPSNPYSATKAGGEMLVHAYHRSFAVPTIITRTMNIFGERQQITKSVPMFLKKILNREEVPLHVGPHSKFGSRQWMYVESYVDSLMFLLANGAVGETYHVAGEEKSNLEIATTIAGIAQIPLIPKLVNVEVFHKAHDLRYSISDKKIREIGWKPPIGFDEGINKTVRWTMENREWLE